MMTGQRGHLGRGDAPADASAATGNVCPLGNFCWAAERYTERRAPRARRSMSIRGITREGAFCTNTRSSGMKR